MSICNVYSHSYCHILSQYLRCMYSLAEQAEVQERQEQKVSKLMEELEASNSDRDSLEKKYQEAGKDLVRLMSELAQTQTE